MSTMVLDVSSEGLMDQIMSLFAPPTSENAESNANTETVKPKDYMEAKRLPGENNLSSILTATVSGSNEDQWKKPRANCHDFCDSCGTYDGERLVCDRCPASFHLECLNPPMDPEDASTGVWYCHRCTMLLKDDSDSSSTNSSITSSQISWSTSGQQSFKRKVGRPRTRNLPSNALQESLLKKYLCMSEDNTGTLLILSQLDQCLRYMNPKEFELPKDFQPNVCVEGSFKSESERKQKSVIELENGMVPYPVQICNICNMTCQIAPLLRCSYCPSCFHLDCLNPPLASFPPRAERWMCPNHPEHVLEETATLSSDPRLSTRLRIWSENLFEIDELNYSHIVNRFLLNTAQRKASALPWRNSSLTAGNKAEAKMCRIQVPGAIKSMYSKRSTPLPRCFQSLKLTEEDLDKIKEEKLNNSLPPSESDQELFVKSLFGLQMSLEAASMSASNHHISESNGSNHLSSSMEEDQSDSEKASPNNNAPALQNENNSWTNKINGFIEQQNSAKRKKEDRIAMLKQKTIASNGTTTATDSADTNKDDDANKHKLSRKERIKKLVSLKSDVESILDDKELVGLLAQEHLSITSRTSSNDLNPAELSAARALTCLARDRSKIQHVHRQLVPSSALKRKRDLRDSLPLWESVKCRAVLSSVSCAGPQVRLSRRTTYIGTDSRSHVCLSEFDQTCQFMSVQHAVIFYDERCRLFELVNYSQHGIRVDGVIYTNNDSLKDIYTPKIHDMVTQVRNILVDNHLQQSSAHTPAKIRKTISSSNMPLHSAWCNCQQSFSDEIKDGWEGSAILHHGSLIEIGCLKLVFSIVDENFV